MRRIEENLYFIRDPRTGYGYALGFKEWAFEIYDESLYLNPDYKLQKEFDKRITRPYDLRLMLASLGIINQYKKNNKLNDACVGGYVPNPTDKPHWFDCDDSQPTPPRWICECFYAIGLNPYYDKYSLYVFDESNPRNHVK